MNRNKRILAILPSKEFYGKERSNIEVYNLLAKNGADLTVLVNKHANNRLKSYTSHLKTTKIIFPDRHHSRFRYIKYAYELIISNISFLIILLKIRPDDIFMCTEITFYDLFIPLYFTKSKIIYRIGDAPAYPKLSNYKFNFRIWKNVVCQKTDTFVCISKYIKTEVEKTGRNNSNDVVIHNYPPNRLPTNDNESIKYINSDFIKIGYLGQVIKEKGVDIFILAAIEIIKIHHNAIFYIAGSLDYDSKFSNKLLNLVAKANLSNNIIFLDEIGNIRLFFENIDILCVPSIKQEPLGNVLVEAKSYSTPCIIFNSGGMPELIKHQEDGFICSSQTIQSLIKGFEYYIENPNLIKTHGNNAYKSVAKLKIDYSNFKNKWLQVFNL